jgi:hypothetical protein
MTVPTVAVSAPHVAAICRTPDELRHALAGVVPGRSVTVEGPDCHVQAHRDPQTGAWLVTRGLDVAVLGTTAACMIAPTVLLVGMPVLMVEEASWVPTGAAAEIAWAWTVDGEPADPWTARTLEVPDASLCGHTPDGVPEHWLTPDPESAPLVEARQTGTGDTIRLDTCEDVEALLTATWRGTSPWTVTLVGQFPVTVWRGPRGGIIATIRTRPGVPARALVGSPGVGAGTSTAVLPWDVAHAPGPVRVPRAAWMGAPALADTLWTAALDVACGGGLGVSVASLVSVRR